MQRVSILTLGTTVFLIAAAIEAQADWVELANNDLIQGEIVSLDRDKLKLQSENFGEMIIPRNKVRLMGLGERPLPAATQTAAAKNGSQQFSSQLPSLENPKANQLLQQVLGGGGIDELSETINKTRDDLKRLQRDMKSTSEGDALESYIQIFELFGNLVPRSNSAAPKLAPKPSQPKPGPQPPAQE